jgi:hypothetical protein
VISALFSWVVPIGFAAIAIRADLFWKYGKWRWGTDDWGRSVAKGHLGVLLVRVVAGAAAVLATFGAVRLTIAALG